MTQYGKLLLHSEQVKLNSANGDEHWGQGLILSCSSSKFRSDFLKGLK